MYVDGERHDVQSWIYDHRTDQADVLLPRGVQVDSIGRRIKLEAGLLYLEGVGVTGSFGKGKIVVKVLRALEP